MKIARASVIFITLLGGFLPALPSVSVCAAQHSSPAHAVADSRYTRPHSLKSGFEFTAQDGWETVNITNLSYKYRREDHSFPENVGEGIGISRRGSKSKNSGSSDSKVKSNVGSAIKGLAKDIVKGLKGIGKPEPVTITW
jgi:hypothetical protein